MFRCVNARMWNLSWHVIVYISVDWDCFRTVWYFWLDCHYSGDPRSLHGHIAIRVSFMNVNLDPCPPMHMYRCVDARICIPGGHIYIQCVDWFFVVSQSEWLPLGTFDFTIKHVMCTHTFLWQLTITTSWPIKGQEGTHLQKSPSITTVNCQLPQSAKKHEWYYSLKIGSQFEF